jgi:phosphoribosylanthranilate isomerase
LLIKICGITRPEDAAAAIAAGADMVGLVFVPATPREVTVDRVGWARSLHGVLTVGVFRDAPLDHVEQIRDALDLDWVQLHGDEPDSWLERLGQRVLRRVRVAADGPDWGRVEELGRRCLPLIDPGAGDGQVWDWRVLAQRPDLEFGLAGGLDPDTVAEAVHSVRPRLVDVSSGVETSPGVKDAAKIAAFVQAARAAC